MASYRRLPSGVWQATVKHPAGRRYTRTDPLKSVVIEWATQLELSIRRGDFIDPRAGKLTLAAWWEVWLSGRVVARATASKNETHWRVHIEPAFGSWPLAQISTVDVQQWVARLVRDGVGGEATATALRLLRQLLGAAVVAKRIRDNPAEGVKAPRPPRHVDRFLSIEEADRLLEAITMPDRSIRVRPVGVPLPRVPDPESRLLVRLMLECGLRWQEAAGLHVFRVDLRRRVLRVQEVIERAGGIKGQPKSEAGSRVVPLTDELAGLLGAHLAGRPKEGLVFSAPGGGELVYSNWLKRVWNPSVAAAGLARPLPTPHDCRHSYGSWLAEGGVPPHEIMTLMGHSSLRAVERYIHASEARLERARLALGARRAHEGAETKKGPGSASGESGA